MKIIKSLLALIMALCVWSCSNEEPSIDGNACTIRLKVAVIMPEKSQTQWERTAQWALSNIKAAQSLLKEAVEIELEWKDESDTDIETYINSVAKDESYHAIIGPFTSSHARIAAAACLRSGKTLLLPMATSTELQRMYASTPNIWNLVQSDITQCELLILQAKLYGKSEISLIAPDSEYGRSFSDWFSFQAAEAKLKVGSAVVYSNSDELLSAMRDQATGTRLYDKALVFVPGDDEDAIAFDKEYGELKGDDDYLDYPLVLCSDNMYSPQIAERVKNGMYEGLAPSASPESGFNEAYLARFGSYPIPGEAQLFDALHMIAFAAAGILHSEKSLNDALLEMSQGRDSWHASWLTDDLRRSFEAIAQGRQIDLSGVTGDWTFDSRNKTCILNTTYEHWLMAHGRVTLLEYVSADGSSRTTSQYQAWENINSTTQIFDSAQQDLIYPELKDNWALIIAGSDDWANYRHQADALAMYQTLKRHGYDDRHIIYISEDNIAYDPRNLYQGVVKVRPEGENLYHDIAVDYKLSDLTFYDLEPILTGTRSDRLQQVVEATSNSNIFIYWCGHGMKNQLAWGNSLVSSGYIANIFRKMRDRHSFRKIFFALDACYSGTIGNACAGIEGLLVMSAANASEPSKADMKDTEMGIWLSNGFTRAFQETLDANPRISVRDLYYSLARNTVGSHVTVSNAEQYGNLYNSSMDEFINP